MTRPISRIARAIVGDAELLLLERDGLVTAVTDPPTTVEVIADWERYVDVEGDRMDVHAITSWLAPVMPRKLICVGTNYRDHVAEMAAAGGPPPTKDPFPFGFFKPPETCVRAHKDTVAIPAYAKQLDWEAELAVVVGDPGLLLSEDPMRGVFGYAVFNDLSVRDFVPFPHALGLDAVVSKGFDGSAPLGPWITLADEIGDVQDLSIRLWVNNELKQDSSTSQMIFGVRDIVRHFARVGTLRPGDVIATGTPAGVGAGQQPREHLAEGDVVSVSIEGLGRLETQIVSSQRKP